MFSNKAFEVLEAFKQFANSEESIVHISDIDCIKLLDDGVRIGYCSLKHSDLFKIAEAFADKMHCANCSYEVTSDDWSKCADGKIKMCVGENEIPVEITVGLHSINIAF